MEGGAWWATVHRVTKSRTRLSDFTFTFFKKSLLSDIKFTYIQESFSGCDTLSHSSIIH